MIAYVTHCSQTLAIMAIALLVLVYLPGHPPFYALASPNAAKLYANSLMAMLNSRVKLISLNAHSVGPPIWNESFRAAESFSSTERAQGIVFHRERGTDSDCSFSSFPGSTA